MLCFHGRRQSASTFASKLFGRPCAATQSEVVVSSSGIEFVFVNGTHVADTGLLKHVRARGAQCELYSWYCGGQDLSETLESVHNLYQKWAPDGLLGFSEGGALIAAMCREDNDLLHKPAVAVILSGYFPQKYHGPMEDAKIHPFLRASLHVFGERDQLVAPRKSRACAEYMGGETHSIPGVGHAIPPAPFAEEVICRWILENDPSVDKL